jgi:hypothetical protein
MAYKYTSKNSTQIKAIIAELESKLQNANASGKQSIDYNGIKYSIDGFVESVNKQIEFWLDKLSIAMVNEGKLSNKKRFERYEDYV